MAPLTMTRQKMFVAFPCFCVEPRTPHQRNLLLALVLGTRLGIDWHHTAFDPVAEAPRVDIAKKPAEAPSAFGDRLLRLLPRLAVEVAEFISQTKAVQQVFVHDSLRIVYLREVMKNLHMLSTNELEQMPYDTKRLHELARAALFHEQGSYRPRPKTEKLRHGRIRTYTSSEGLMASRACLMPDFDLDAAREHGFVSIPCLDTMVVAEPRSIADRDDLRWELLTRTLKIWRESKTPFSKIIIDLSLTTASFQLQSQWSTQDQIAMPECLVTHS